MKSFLDRLSTDIDLAEKLIGAKTYRDFLVIYITEAKKSWKNFSFNYIALKSNLSKGLVVAIVNGKKRITQKTVSPLIQALKLPISLEQYFLYLVAAEESDILRPKKTTAEIQKYLKKLSQLHLDSMRKDSAFSGQVYQRASIPLIYASLGSLERGASLEEVKSRTKIDPKILLSDLEAMVGFGIVRFDESSERWVATRQIVFNELKDGINFLKFFHYACQKSLSESAINFSSSKKLFYANAFSTNDKNMQEMKRELREALNALVVKYEVEEGDMVGVLQLGLV